MNLSSRGARRSLIRILLAGLWLGLGCGLAGTLAGCRGAVGSGNGPDHIVITAPAPAGTAPLASLRMYECLTSALRALMYFQDGSVGDFTSRVTWSSSNPGAVQISNGDIAVVGGAYARGTLVPFGTGNAIITASYFGIVGQTSVSVGTPKNIALKAVVQGNYVPLAKINLNNDATAKSFTMGEGTQQQLAATALLDDVETDVTAFGTFGFQVPNDAVASFSLLVPGLLVAGRDGGPVVPQVSFPPCTLTSITDPNNIVSMNVTPVTSIAMLPEFLPDQTQPISATNALPPLIVGNSQRIKVGATLRDPDPSRTAACSSTDPCPLQDVSGQSVMTVSGGVSGATFGGLSGASNLLFATQAGGPLILQSTFDVDGSALTAPTITTSAVSEVLQSFSICYTNDVFAVVDMAAVVGSSAVTVCPTIPASTTTQPAVPTVQANTLSPLQFHAIGYYGQDTNNQPIAQDITRTVTWSSNDITIATIANGGNAAGQASGLQQGATIIEAADAAAINIPQVFIALTVNPAP